MFKNIIVCFFISTLFTHINATEQPAKRQAYSIASFERNYEGSYLAFRVHPQHKPVELIVKTYPIDNEEQKVLFLKSEHYRYLICNNNENILLRLTMSASYALYTEMEWIFNEWTNQKPDNNTNKVLQNLDAKGEKVLQPYRMHFTLFPSDCSYSDCFLTATERNRTILQEYNQYLQSWLRKNLKSLSIEWIVDKYGVKWERKAYELNHFEYDALCLSSQDRFSVEDLDNPKLFDDKIQDVVDCIMASENYSYIGDDNNSTFYSKNTHKSNIDKQNNISISANTVNLLTILAVLYFGLGAIVIVALSK